MFCTKGEAKPISTYDLARIKDRMLGTEKEFDPFQTKDHAEAMKKEASAISDYLMQREEHEITMWIAKNKPAALERLTRLLHGILASGKSMLCPRCYSFETFTCDNKSFLCGKCNKGFMLL